MWEKFGEKKKSLELPPIHPPLGAWLFLEVFFWKKKGKKEGRARILKLKLKKMLEEK